MRFENIPHAKIDPDPNQPRQLIEAVELKELALSIRDLGQLQPVIVFCEGDRFTLVDGHRRHAALGVLEAPDVRALILDKRPDGDVLLMTQLAANCMRVDLKPTEKADAFQRLQASRGWSNAELAKAMHISRSKVTQILSYLNLPEDVQRSLDAGELAGSTAYAIARAPDAATQTKLLAKARKGQLKRDDALREVSQPSSRKDRVRAVFRLQNAEIRMSTSQRLDLDECVTTLQQLIRECRKASKQGLDVTTFERVLHDRLNHPE